MRHELSEGGASCGGTWATCRERRNEYMRKYNKTRRATFRGLREEVKDLEESLEKKDVELTRQEEAYMELQTGNMMLNGTVDALKREKEFLDTRIAVLEKQGSDLLQIMIACTGQVVKGDPDSNVKSSIVPSS
jgi:chromosome segregation ATPase